jgi:hypothetical protein
VGVGILPPPTCGNNGRQLVSRTTPGRAPGKQNSPKPERERDVKMQGVSSPQKRAAKIGRELTERGYLPEVRAVAGYPDPTGATP